MGSEACFFAQWQQQVRNCLAGRGKQVCVAMGLLTKAKGPKQRCDLYLFQSSDKRGTLKLHVVSDFFR